MSVRERLLTVQIHEAVNIYNSQAQLDKADVEMHRRLGGFNFQRRRLSTFFYRDDDIVSTSSIYRILLYIRLLLSDLIIFTKELFIADSKLVGIVYDLN